MKRIIGACVAVYFLMLIFAVVFAAERSSKWHGVRDAYHTAHPACEACGGNDDIEVHHVRPFHLWSEMELEPTNLITLCQRCHILIGHLGNYRAYNPLVREYAARHLAMVKARPTTRDEAAAFEKRFALAP